MLPDGEDGPWFSARVSPELGKARISSDGKRLGAKVANRAMLYLVHFPVVSMGK